MMYQVYRSPWNAGPEEIDWDTPFYVSATNPIVIPNFAGDNKGTIYLGIRETYVSHEERNFNTLRVVIK